MELQELIEKKHKLSIEMNSIEMRIKELTKDCKHEDKRLTATLEWGKEKWFKCNQCNKAIRMVEGKIIEVK